MDQKRRVGREARRGAFLGTKGGARPESECDNLMAEKVAPSGVSALMGRLWDIASSSL